MQISDELNSRFAIPGVVKIDPGSGGLTRVVINSGGGAAHVYLHGAHVTHYQPRGQEPVLFLSQKSNFAPGKAIRGGVPVIFPWFGPKANEPSAPMHGFARVLDWELTQTRQISGDTVIAQFELKPNDATRAAWPHDFRLQYEVAVGPTLALTLRVTNAGKAGIHFEEALHNYLAVGDVRSARIDGLAGRRFIDKVDGMRAKIQPPGPIRIEAETDRVYLDTEDAVTVSDTVLLRALRVEKQGSRSTVLWNPWIAKAKAMADFGDEEWPRMLCVETANVAENAIVLQPGEVHTMRAQISVSRE